MIANYGFKDGSGDWYVTIDTQKCNGCGECVEMCPAEALVVGPDEIDVFRKDPVASVKHEERKKVRYTCAPCKPGSNAKPSPCVAVCERKAISHSDGWKKLSQGSTREV
jgi:ferredoxin